MLERCVTHTHAVYAGILFCSESGEDIAAKALKDAGIPAAYSPG